VVISESLIAMSVIVAMTCQESGKFSTQRELRSYSPCTPVLRGTRRGDNNMAELMKPITSTERRPTTIGLVDAWRAAKPIRRQQALVAGLATIGVAALATTAVPPAIAIVIGIVGLLAGAIAIIDLHEHRIPNQLLTFSLAAVVAGATVGAFISSRQIIGEVIVGLIVAAFPLFAIRYGHGLAMGDVKMAAVLGAAGGLIHPVVGLITVFVAALSSGVFALVKGRKRLALGPWLWAGFGTACTIGIVFVRVRGQ
jgi:leader peptidase (prepilin peptidase) / N-methyltransferase